jgi:hypothetical protein
MRYQGFIVIIEISFIGIFIDFFLKSNLPMVVKARTYTLFYGVITSRSCIIIKINKLQLLFTLICLASAARGQLAILEIGQSRGEPINNYIYWAVS